jgi:hypothetical protein
MAFAELISWAKDRPKWHVGRPAGTGAVRQPQSVLPALRRRLAARHGRNREQPLIAEAIILPAAAIVSALRLPTIPIAALHRIMIGKTNSRSQSIPDKSEAARPKRPGSPDPVPVRLPKNLTADVDR